MSNQQAGVIQVKIYDQVYSLRTSGDPERLRQLCAELDKRMHDLALESGTADTLKVAVLAALGLADELGRAKETLQKVDDSLGRRSLACVSMLDRFLY
jgi:cell division protein ZapA (FtsZ GTPase activity inhibitor)